MTFKSSHITTGIMAKKGTEKNTKNKAKHTKLLNRKKEKLRREKEERKLKIKAILTKAKESQTGETKSE